MAKRSILHIVTQNELGGAQRAVLTLAQGCREAFAPHVAIGGVSTSGLHDACRAAGIPVTRLPNLDRALSPTRDWAAIRDIQKLVRAQEPTIVHAHSSKAGVLTSLALRDAPRPPWLVYTAHGWAFLEPVGALRRALYRLAERLADPRRDATIVLSAAERQAAIAAGLKQDTLHVIPNGVAPIAHDRASARATLTRLGIPDTACVIGTVAHFYQTKNIPALIRAFANLDPNSHLVLIGDGHERPAIEAAARPIHERVHLLGTRTDARHLMDGFDLFALPSVKEGMPFALLEAMEAGLPVLATNVGGITQVIADGMNGFLCTPDNLEKGLLRAMENRNAWAAIGAAGQETIRALFQETRMVADTRTVYHQLASPHSFASN